MGIDCFTKWVVAAPLAVLPSTTVAQWFHREVVCCFGVPNAVRTDRGIEFRGQFEAYCHGMGIRTYKISTGWPRGQGQIERYNGLFKALVRKCTSRHGGTWVEWMPDLLWAMRALVTRAHGHSAYRLVFK